MRYNPVISAVSLLIVFQSITATALAKDPPATAERFRIPLHFIQNAGQWDAEVRYGVIQGGARVVWEQLASIRALRTDVGWCCCIHPNNWGATELTMFESRILAVNSVATHAFLGCQFKVPKHSEKEVPSNGAISLANHYHITRT
jgi:hypothetical protein